MNADQYIQFHLRLPAEQIPNLAAILEEQVEASWWDEASNRLSGLIPADQREAFDHYLSELIRQTGCGPVQVAFEPLQDRDWLKDQQKRLPPLPIGRFWLYFDGRFKGQSPAESTPLFLSDTGAFGSGHHVTTHHCLLMLERIKERRPLKVADIGCGSGILSLAVASQWKCDQVACDIDPKSVLVTRENLRANGANHIQTAVSNGFAHPLIRQQGPYDLILANILTDIVIDLAPDINELLTPNGLALLSGISSTHCDSVLKAYEPYGLRVEHREEGNDWSTVALTRR